MKRKIPAFIHIEKTGGTSLVYSLRENFPLSHCDIIPRDKSSNVISKSDIVHARRIYPRLKSLSGHSIRPFLDLQEQREDLAFYTVLRQGTDRYVSEYHHDTIKRGFDGGLSEWLKYDSRWNHQTKSLAGTDDLEKAKSVLENNLAVAGIMEAYDQFVAAVQAVFFPVYFDAVTKHRNRAGLPLGDNNLKPRIAVPAISEDERKKCEEVNELDNKLYEYAKKTVWPEHFERTKRVINQ